MAFVPRLSRPTAGNKYYIRKAAGGYSNAIKGSPTDSQCDVLSNCVGYAYGRFNEIGGYGYCKHLAPVNAENFIQYKGSCEVGQTPKVGACMVWRKGATLSNSDGAGHVAIVEKVISDTEVVTSESGYGSAPFWTQTRKKGSNGRWGAGSAYTFLGFIYNPAVSEEEKTPTIKPKPTKPKEEGYEVKLKTLTKGSTGSQVKALQALLIGYGGEVAKIVTNAGGADGSFGQATDTAVRKYQKAKGLTVDGSVGPNTWAKLLGV